MTETAAVASSSEPAAEAMGKLPSPASIDGADKALLLLVSIDESVATRVLSHLGSEEVLALRKASEQLLEIDPKVLLVVHREFVGRMRQGMPARRRR